MKRKVSEERLNNKIVCHICDKLCKGYKGLSKHIQFQHSISSETYYHDYLMDSNENICDNPNCNNKVSFRNLREGYVGTCSNKCYGIMHTGKNNYFYGKTHTKESMEQMVNTRRENNSYKHSKEIKQKISNSLKGREHDWGVSGMTGKKHTKESKDKMRRSRYRVIKKNFKKYGRAESIKTTEKKIKASLAKVCKRPNKFEEKIGNYLNELFPNKFKYVGDGSVLINGRSPDYIDKDNNIVILCHGLYWHLLRYDLEDTPENKRKIELEDSKSFLEENYEVWFIWELPYGDFSKNIQKYQ